MQRSTRWSPPACGLGAWMLWCVAASAVTTAGRSSAEAGEPVGVPVVALLAAAGVLALVGGVRPSRWSAAGLGVIAPAVPPVTVLTFGDRGTVGAVGVGLALAALPLAAAAAVLRRQRARPPVTPEVSPFLVARVGCGALGGALVVLFGTPVVHSWLRGVAPYDLWGLSPSTIGQRLPETVPVLLAALGLVALAAVFARTPWVPVGAAAVLTVLITAAAVQMDASSALLTGLRLLLLGGGGVAVTVLVAAAALSRPRAATPA